MDNLNDRDAGRRFRRLEGLPSLLELA